MKYVPYKTKFIYKKLAGNPDLNKYLNNLNLTEEMVNLLKNSPEENNGQLMLGIEPAKQYFLTNEKLNICIVGDYDADGVTSTSIVYLTLKELFPDYNLSFYIPHRVNDGYGLSNKIVDKVEKKMPGVDTIITVDNGIAAHEAIEYAKSKGIFVILTDHHEIGNSIPDANIIIHPALMPYPFAKISGATVAYKLCMYLLDELADESKSEIIELKEYLLQLAAISIVSDVMPVGSPNIETLEVNENRYLLKKGLESLRNNPNWRLNQFFKMAKIQYETMDETTIGFYIAPVINAVGRLDYASNAVEALTSDNQDVVILKNSIMIYLNEERKRLKKEYMDKIEAIVAAAPESAAVAVRCNECHEGLIGIIAGNLKEKHQKPAIVFAETKINGKKAWKGSARSIDTVNMYEVLSDIVAKRPELIYQFGGHAGAAGMTICDDVFDEFENELQQRIDDITKHTECVVYYQNILSQNIPAFAKSLCEIKPLGNGLPKPIVKTGVFINQIDFFFGSGHVKLSNNQGNEYWLYGKLNEFMSDADMLEGFQKVMDNTQKKINEGATPDEVKNVHWERWKNFKGTTFELIMEMDYGQFMGQICPVPSMLDYHR